jgi:hypothetical protein
MPEAHNFSFTAVKPPVNFCQTHIFILGISLAGAAKLAHPISDFVFTMAKSIILYKQL